MYPFRCKICKLDYRIKSSKVAEKNKGATAGVISFSDAKGFSPRPKYRKTSLLLGVVAFISSFVYLVFFTGSPLGSALLSAGFLGVFTYFFLLPIAFVFFYIAMAYIAINLIVLVLSYLIL
jgi:hypothetical protein